MAEFAPIWEFTVSREGGFQNLKNDSANYNSKGELIGTKYGVSASAWESYFKRVPTVEDIKNMKYETAREIADSMFWDDLQGDKIKSQKIAHVIFQEKWGSGFGGFKRIRQMINKVAGKTVLEDKPAGFRGIASFPSLVNSLDEDKLYLTISDNAIRARFAIVIKNPDKREFLTGWMNRWKGIDNLYLHPATFAARWKMVDAKLKLMKLKPTRTDYGGNPQARETNYSSGIVLFGLALLAFGIWGLFAGQKTKTNPQQQMAIGRVTLFN